MKSSIVISGDLPKIVHLPRSKSYANRLILLASLSSERKTIQNIPLATDVTNLIEALKAVGFKIKKNQQEVIFEEGDLYTVEEKNSKLITVIEVGEGGTTARFLATLLLLGKKQYHLILGDRLKMRPWSEFIEISRSLGAEVHLEDQVLKVRGPIQFKQDLEVDCSRTTQFASAFQMIASRFQKKVIPVNMKSSQSYWEMTELLISKFRESSVFDVPIDWSSASYPMAFAALNHEIFFPDLTFDPYQSDAKFLDLLKEFKAIEFLPDGLIVRPFQVSKSIKMNVSDCLDLVPTLGYFLAHIPGVHELSGIENLVYKESDRLNEVIKLLHQFERTAQVKGTVLEIQGHEKIIQEKKFLNLPDDHRMVMTGALFLRHHAGGEVSPKESVNKSYPGFFDLLK